MHLFDFDQNLYDENVIVLFRKFIREEKTFDNLDALKSQIQADEKTYVNILILIAISFRSLVLVSNISL